MIHEIFRLKIHKFQFYNPVKALDKVIVFKTHFALVIRSFKRF